MSVKCGYSSAYYPLLKNLLRGDSPDLNAFKVFINEHFTNPDEVFNMFVSGVYTDSAPTPVSEPKKISSRLGIELPPEGSSPQQYYIDNTIQMLYTLEELEAINNDSIDDVTFEMQS